GETERGGSHVGEQSLSTAVVVEKDGMKAGVRYQAAGIDTLRGLIGVQASGLVGQVPETHQHGAERDKREDDDGNDAGRATWDERSHVALIRRLLRRGIAAAVCRLSASAKRRSQ